MHVGLLQSNLLVVKEHTGDNELEGHDSRALLTMRTEGRRRKGSIFSSAKKYIKKAKDGAEKAATSAINGLKAASRTQGFLPNCLKNGNIVDCVKDELSSSADWIKNRASALQTGLDNLMTCPAYSSLGKSFKDLVKDVKCTSTTSMTYPTGIKTDWEPAVTTASKKICTGIGGLNTDILKNLQSTFAQCAEDLYNGVATGISAANAAISANCKCKADFGIYFGATISVAAGVSGSIATGFIVGCDGCNFKFKPWWSFFGGVTSNVAADAGLMVGVSSTWGAFWGQALVQAASAGPNVVAANVGVGISLPQLSIQTSTQEVSKKVCVSGQCITVKKSLGGVPSGITFTPPEFGTVDFAITGGVSILPVDASSGFATCYAID